MAIIKYSIGQITSVVDKNETEQKEIKDEVKDVSIVVCKKCGLQNMIKLGQTNVKCDCGDKLLVN